MKVKNKNRSSIKTRQKIREAFAELLKEKNELSNMSVSCYGTTGLFDFDYHLEYH